MAPILLFVLFERLSFFCVKSHLFLYIIQYLKYTRLDGIIYVHSFIFLSYSFCLLGGVISARLTGQHFMIIISLILYALGIMSIIVSSMVESTLFFTAGILFISFSAGGIKPNISSLGADLLRRIYSTVDKIDVVVDVFFSNFYLVINLSSFVVLFITPGTIRNILSVLSWRVTQNDLDLEHISEYFLVFCFALISITVAALIFLSICLYSMIYSTFIRRVPADIPEVQRSKDAGYSIKKNIPIIIGWAIYDQMSSTWIDQGKRMERKVKMLSLSTELLPSQLILVNSFLLIVLLPFYKKGSKSFLSVLSLKDTNKHRMSYGLSLIGISYFLYYIIDLCLSKTALHILFQIPQIVVITLGEALVSVSGMAISYSEGAENGKSIAMGYWYFNIALGNLLVILLSSGYKYLNIPREYQAISYLVLMCLAVSYSFYSIRDVPPHDKHKKESENIVV